MKNSFLILVIFCVGVPISSIAQIDAAHRQPDYVDLTDLRAVIRGQKDGGEEKESGIPEKGKLMLFVVPVLGANPSLGTFYGVGGTGAMFLGDPKTTSISNLTGSTLFTTKS